MNERHETRANCGEEQKKNVEKKVFSDIFFFKGALRLKFW